MCVFQIWGTLVMSPYEVRILKFIELESVQALSEPRVWILLLAFLLYCWVPELTDYIFTLSLGWICAVQNSKTNSIDTENNKQLFLAFSILVSLGWLFQFLSLCSHTISVSTRKEERDPECNIFFYILFFNKGEKSFSRNPITPFVWTASSTQPYSMTDKRTVTFSWLVYTNNYDQCISLRSWLNCCLNKIMVLLREKQIVLQW